MQTSDPKLAALIITTSFYYVILLPLVKGSLHEDLTMSKNHKIVRHDNDKLSHQLIYDIEVHGLLLWLSMGLLMPVGILTIRMSNREDPRSTRVMVFFYLHVFLQTLSVLLGTAGALMSIKKFGNSFNNHHQRIGLALYIAILVQAFLGIFRPHRGKKERSMWYLIHWMLGTIISMVGIINIYIGLNAYHNKASKSVALWTILFTIQVSFMGFFYLFQDKWEYMQKQGVILGQSENSNEEGGRGGGVAQQSTPNFDQQIIILPPQPCGKQNALKNLFD